MPIQPPRCPVSTSGTPIKRVMQRLLTLHSPLTQSQSPTSSPGTGDELPCHAHHLSLLLFLHRIYSYSDSDYELLSSDVLSEVRGFRGQRRAITCTSLREDHMPGTGLCTHHSNMHSRQGTIMCRQESDPQPSMIPEMRRTRKSTSLKIPFRSTCM